MSELFDKQSECTKREFEKTVHVSSRKPTKKCAVKTKETKKVDEKMMHA